MIMGFQLERRIGKHRIKFLQKLQNKFKAKNLVKDLKELKEIIETSFPKHVQDHYVEEALKELNNATETLKEGEHNVGILLRNTFVEEDQELQELQQWELDVLNALKHVQKILKSGAGKEWAHKDQFKTELVKFEKEWSHLLIVDEKKREATLRAEYKRFFTVIDAAEHADSKGLMESVTSFWKNENASYLDYFFIRNEQKKQMKDVAKEKDTHKRTAITIRNLEKDLDAAIYKKNKAEEERVHKEVLEMNKEIHDMASFFEKASKMAHLTIMRVVILDLTLMALSKKLIEECEAYVEKIYLPKQQILETKEELKKHMLKEADTTIREYAQAIRIELGVVAMDEKRLKEWDYAMAA